MVLPICVEPGSVRYFVSGIDPLSLRRLGEQSGDYN